jgi:Arc/MetJ family transcription regulator
MRTNIDLNDELIAEAMRVAGVHTKKEAVELGLRALIEARKKKDLTDLAGKIKFVDNYDHKKLRRTRADVD